jgi:hypothetical protein
LDIDKNKIDGNKILLTIYVMIVLAVIFAEFMTYGKTNVHHLDIFSLAIGFVGYFGIFMYSQKIIDNNSFRQFVFIALAILVVSIIKQALTNYNQLPLFVAALPLLFVGYFRVLTSLFYKDYPNATNKPTVIFATKSGQTYFDGKEEGYNPPMKERVFSLLLFMGFMFFAFGLIWVLKKVIP